MDNFNLKNQIMYKENGEKKYAYVCLFFDIKYHEYLFIREQNGATWFRLPDGAK